jgi:hypothetical protein
MFLKKQLFTKNQQQQQHIPHELNGENLIFFNFQNTKNFRPRNEKWLF